MGNQPLAMQEIQQISLQVLKTISRICEEQGFRYTLAFGTLIGAIRHKGYIPWDDDVDILMPRPDYEQFLIYLQNNPIENIDFINWHKSHRCVNGITRVFDNRYRVVEDIFGDYGLGVFVDVYPVDGLGNELDFARSVNSYAIDLADIVVDVTRKDTHVWKKAHSSMGRLKQWLIFRYRKLKGHRYYLSQLQEYAMSRPFEDYKYVGNINWTWLPLCFEREWFNDLIKVPFEDGEFCIVKEYDSMLRQQYGDYMQLPPEDKRVYHHCYTAIKK